MLEVLAGVEDIEAAHPEHYCNGQDDDPEVQGAAYCDPGGGGGYSEREAEDEVGPACPALHVAVGQQHEERQRGELERQAVQHGGGSEEEQRAYGDKAGYVGGAELAGGKCAGCGARVGCVEVAVDEAVEAHGGAACGDHADYDPAEDGEPRPSASGEYCSGEREGQREDGVFPLDHLKGYCCALPEGGHISMVRDKRPERTATAKERPRWMSGAAEDFR